MKFTLHHIARRPSIVLVLLPFFFITHVLTDNPELFHFPAAAFIGIIYIFCGFLIAFVLQRWYRNWSKVVLISVSLLCFEFFFAAIYDSLQTRFHGFFFSRYRFLLVLFILLLFLFGRWLKKTDRDFSNVFLFLNTLFSLLILTDLLSFHFIKERNARPWPAETVTLSNITGNKPYIHLIVADGYPGKEGLEGYFRCSNKQFTDSLTALGFHVNDSARSNYNFTTHSIASLLNMTYLRETRKNGADLKEVNRCLGLINNNLFTRHLSENGYEIINHSIFPINGKEAAMNPGFLPTSSTIITRQTFSGRFIRDMVFQLANVYHNKKLIRYFHGPVLKGNQELPLKTISAAGQRNQAPRFVYTHLVMPHYPYTHDSSGSETSEYRWKDVRDTVLFKRYLKYTNRQLLSLIRNIQQASDTPPIIILIGDHGFREFNKKIFEPLQFSCLQAVYYPDGNYNSFYPGMSNVNLMRVLLRDQFNQPLSLLKDSNFVLTDPLPGHH